MTVARQNKRKEKRGNGTLSKFSFHKRNWLEYTTVGLALWFLIYPKPYGILFTAWLCMPIIGLLLNGMTGRPSISSLVKISEDSDGSDDVSVTHFNSIAACLIVLRVINDYKLENFYNMLIPGTVAFATILLILFATHKLIDQAEENKTTIYVFLILNVCLYSFTGTYGANCIYDNSDPIVFQAEVVDKRDHMDGWTMKYSVKVTPWGDHDNKEEIAVSHEQFDEIQIGQTVNIDLKKGLFNIPWYYLER